MRQLAETVTSIGVELFDYKGKVVYQESSDKAYLTDNPNRRCPDISKAREHLGYEPEMAIADGLKRALTWYGGHRE